MDGTDEEASTINGLHARGLPCVTVLLGMFDRRTGWPLVGVVAQPFWRKIVADGVEAAPRWRGRVACGISVGGKTAVNVSPPPSESGMASSEPGRNEHDVFELTLLLSTILYSGISQ